MPHDFEDATSREALTDEELGSLIGAQFSDYQHLDTDLVDVHVEAGRVTLSGRVGTEREYQQFEHVVTDVLGIRAVSNEIVVDELVRKQLSEEPEVAAAEHAAEEGSQSGSADRTSDTADHLLDDTAAEQFGTRDSSAAIERGQAYEPPSHPIQEGTESREQH